jgi:hypothetical protein
VANHSSSRRDWATLTMQTAVSTLLTHADRRHRNFNSPLIKNRLRKAEFRLACTSLSDEWSDQPGRSIKETSARSLEVTGDGKLGRGTASRSSGVSRSMPPTRRRSPDAAAAPAVQEPTGGQPAGTGMAGWVGNRFPTRSAIEFSVGPSSAADCCSPARWSQAPKTGGMRGVGGLRGLRYDEPPMSVTSLAL